MSYQRRLDNLQNKLHALHLDGMYVTNLTNVRYLTGFTGSAGSLLVFDKEKHFFTDGRYINQIQKELDSDLFKIFNIRLKNPIIWLKENIKKNEKIILDSWLFTSRNYNSFNAWDFFYPIR